MTATDRPPRPLKRNPTRPLTLRELGGHLGVSRMYLIEQIHVGRLRAGRGVTGRDEYLVTRDDVADWMRVWGGWPDDQIRAVLLPVHGTLALVGDLPGWAWPPARDVTRVPDFFALGLLLHTVGVWAVVGAVTAATRAAWASAAGQVRAWPARPYLVGLCDAAAAADHPADAFDLVFPRAAAPHRVLAALDRLRAWDFDPEGS